MILYPLVVCILTVRIIESFGLPKPSLFCNVQRECVKNAMNIRISLCIRIRYWMVRKVFLDHPISLVRQFLSKVNQACPGNQAKIASSFLRNWSGGLIMLGYLLKETTEPGYLDGLEKPFKSIQKLILMHKLIVIP